MGEDTGPARVRAIVTVTVVSLVDGPHRDVFHERAQVWSRIHELDQLDVSFPLAPVLELSVVSFLVIRARRGHVRSRMAAGTDSARACSTTSSSSSSGSRKSGAVSLPVDAMLQSRIGFGDDVDGARRSDWVEGVSGEGA